MRIRALDLRSEPDTCEPLRATPLFRQLDELRANPFAAQLLFDDDLRDLHARAGGQATAHLKVHPAHHALSNSRDPKLLGRLVREERDARLDILGRTRVSKLLRENGNVRRVA